MADLAGALGMLLQGIGLVGNGITGLIQALFAAFGFSIPSWIISIATIILLLITVLAIGQKLGKIILIVLVFLIVSCSSGLLSGFLQVG